MFFHSSKVYITWTFLSDCVYLSCINLDEVMRDAVKAHIGAIEHK